MCEWFALCDNPAAGAVAHPVLGAVPTCTRCANRFALDFLPTERPAVQINMDRIIDILNSRLEVSAYVEQTGGGVATIFAGAIRQEEGYGDRYAAVAGPGTYGWGQRPSVADSVDFCVGADDSGETDPIYCAEVGAVTEVQIAMLIAAQATKADPTIPLSGDEVEALGFDGTGRA